MLRRFLLKPTFTGFGLAKNFVCSTAGIGMLLESLYYRSSLNLKNQDKKLKE